MNGASDSMIKKDQNANKCRTLWIRSRFWPKRGSKQNRAAHVSYRGMHVEFKLCRRERFGEIESCNFLKNLMQFRFHSPPTPKITSDMLSRLVAFFCWSHLYNLEFRTNKQKLRLRVLEYGSISRNPSSIISDWSATICDVQKPELHGVLIATIHDVPWANNKQHSTGIFVCSGYNDDYHVRIEMIQKQSTSWQLKKRSDHSRNTTLQESLQGTENPVNSYIGKAMGDISNFGRVPPPSSLK